MESILMENQEKCKELVSKHLGRKMRSKYKEILYNLLIVNNNIKPGYLFDCGCVNAKSLAGLIQDLYSLKMIQNPLNILTVGLDFVIINQNYMLMFLEDKNSLPKCVNVSASLKKPKLMKDNKIVVSAREIIRSNLSEGLVSIVELSVLDFNVTSLFGVLLGYPVVYWYNTEDDKTENCLSLEPLRLIEVRGYFHSNEQTLNSSFHQIYSFSIPECVFEELDFNAIKWFENLKRSVKWEILFDDIELIEKTVTLPVVNM